MEKLNDFELGYLAAMIDAECHVGIQRDFSNPKRKTPAFVPRFELAMCDKKVIDYVQTLLPSSTKTHVPAKGRRLPYFRLRLTTRKAIDFFKTMLPFVVGKKRQMEIIIEIDSLRQEYSPSRQHNGKPKFERISEEFTKKADVLFGEFRDIQLIKKPRK